MAMSDEKSLLFQERCITLYINGQPAEQILCSQGNWRELAVGYLLSQGRIERAAAIQAVREESDAIHVTIEGPLRPTSFLTARLDALSPFVQKAEVDIPLIRSLGHALQDNAPFGRHRAVIVYGDQQAMFDDAGRHNACDKAIGHAALQGWPLQNCLLGTSGRLSLEMLGKAACGGLPLLFTLKYPSDLCAEYANRLNLLLVARAAGETPVVL